jgi:hypothetical protein
MPEWTKDNITDHPLWHAAAAYYDLAVAGFNADEGMEGLPGIPLWVDLTEAQRGAICVEFSQAMYRLLASVILPVPVD